MVRRNVDPLDLLEDAGSRLAPGDECVLDLDEARLAHPHWAYLGRQAERLGLEVVPSPDESRRDAGVSDAMANDTARDDRTGASGGAARIRLRRRDSGRRWRIGRIDGAAVDDARALFERVFGHPISAEHWRWKYGEGRGSSIGAWRDGRLIAHYGGLSREIVLRGRPAFASQSCDVIVEAAERGTLSRQGPLFLTAATYLEREIGPRAKHTLGFGFPSVRHWRVAEHLGLYGGPAGRVVELSWPALAPGGADASGTGDRASSAARDAATSSAGGRPADAPGSAGPLRRLANRLGGDALHVRRLDLRASADRALADACWAAMAADLVDAIVGVRDARWLEYRYSAHPAASYEVFGLTRGFARRPFGVLVLRRHAQTVELVDVAARPRDVARLVGEARAIAAGWGLPLLHCWVTENVAHWFGADAALADPQVMVPNCAWTEGPPVEEIAGRWWLMGGDTDFR